MRDLSKLPQWAQNEIENLRADVATWKARALSAAGPNGATNVYLHDPQAPGGRGLGLPPNTGLVYVLPGLPTVPSDELRVTHWPDQRIEVCHDENCKSMRLHVSSPDGRLIVRPASSNVLYIEADPR